MKFRYEEILLLLFCKRIPHQGCCRCSCRAGAYEARHPANGRSHVVAGGTAVVTLVVNGGRPEGSVSRRRIFCETLLAAAPCIQPPDEGVRGTTGA